MKYSFLLNTYKSSYKTLKDRLDENDEKIEDIYYDIYKLKNEYLETLSIHSDIIDKFIDNVYLFSNKETNDKFFKRIKNFIKPLTIDNYKILYGFRLYMYQYVNKEFVNSKVSYGTLYLLLMIITGGLLYLPIKINGQVLNIGNNLDKIVTGKDYLYSPLYKKVKEEEDAFMEDLRMTGFAYRGMKDISNLKFSSVAEATTNIAIKENVFILATYFDKMLNLIILLSIDNVKEVFSPYLSINDFKYSMGDLNKDTFDYLGKDFMSNDCLQDFYRRKYIVPKKGITLLTEGGNKCIVVEGEDKLLGYYIAYLEVSENVSNISAFYLTANTNSCIEFYETTQALLNFYGVKGIKLKENIGYYWYSIYRTYYKGFKGSNLVQAVIGSTINYSVTGNSYESGNEGNTKLRTNILVDKEISINAFKRRLPIGQTRSKEAEILAKKLCIKLEPNETVVSPFERKQKVKVSKNFNEN